MKKDADDELQSSLGQVINSFLTRADEDLESEVLPLLDTLDPVPPPREFHVKVLARMDRVIHLWIRRQYPELSRDQQTKIARLYVHYGFLRWNLRCLIERTEGSMGCADKARWVLGQYRQWIMSGQMPEFPDPEGTYWVPRVESGAFWMGVCDSLWDLYQGDPLPYLRQWMQLLNSREDPRKDGDA